MYRSSPSSPQTRSCRARPVDFFLTTIFFFCRSCSVVLISQFSLAWGKTLSSATFVSILTSLACITFPSPLNCRFSYSQTLRFAPIVLALVISFASDTRYSLNDVLETLPGYLALLLHVLSTGTSEHLRSMLAPSVGVKYVSVFNTVGAATFSLIVYVAREILVSIFGVIICVPLVSCITSLDKRAITSGCSPVLSFGHSSGGVFCSKRAQLS